ncbi:transketolase [Candidatus Saccharibacteria bacterium SW_7_54_9]|nr:MAG: transketolase [Candidatus Saccharibacteria bacterium SW_7_54_9]
MSSMHLTPNLYKRSAEQEPIRNGFGRGLVEAGRRDGQVVALCADLTGSTRMKAFAGEFPDRYIEVGVAEQNLVTTASGMAHMDKVPFASSYAAFSPGRNWEQIRTTICLNDQNVKIAGSHAGISVGPDGATHQMLEDIALMRVLPNMRVIVPCDSVQAEKATLEMAAEMGPMYLRLAREKTPIVTSDDTPFEIGKSYVYRKGGDVSLVATGSMVYHALKSATSLKQAGISAEVINCATIKPFDRETIVASAQKTGRVVTLEEGQINGGLAAAVAETLGESQPTPLLRIGMDDRFGESGQPDELMKRFGLTAPDITKKIKSFLGANTGAKSKGSGKTKSKGGHK